MAHLSAAQLETLAQRYSSFASRINAFLDANDVADQHSYTTLSDDATKAANVSTTLAVQAAAIDFDDAAGAFAKLDAATADANAAAARLSNEAASISRSINVAAGMLSLAGALVSGNIPAVFSSVLQIESSIQS